MRFAASRAGISHATWSRIERGMQAADNRFMVADIATALECSPADLTGTAVPTRDRGAAAAQANLSAIRQALIDTDLGDPPTRPVRPVRELDPSVSRVRQLWLACDYAAAGRLLPEALRDTHAATTGPDRYQALVLFHLAAAVASTVMRALGHPADAWLSAERCRSAAEATEDPALLGNAAVKRAMAAASCGSFSRSLAIAQRAIDALSGHRNRSPAIEAYGLLHLVCASACRVLERDDDSANWVAAATVLARRTGETTTLGLHFGPTNVNFWRVGIEADGGNPAHALAIAGQTAASALDVPDRLVASTRASPAPAAVFPIANTTQSVTCSTPNALPHSTSVLPSTLKRPPALSSPAPNVGLATPHSAPYANASDSRRNDQGPTFAMISLWRSTAPARGSGGRHRRQRGGSTLRGRRLPRCDMLLDDAAGDAAGRHHPDGPDIRLSPTVTEPRAATRNSPHLNTRSYRSTRPPFSVLLSPEPEQD
jgi:hypothetical protein